MAATTVDASTGLTNGVSFGIKYTADATDATNADIIFDFGVDYYVTASIHVVNASSTNVNVSLSDAVITYPAAGQVEIANGAATFTITDGYIFYITVQRRGTVLP